MSARPSLGEVLAAAMWFAWIIGGMVIATNWQVAQ